MTPAAVGACVALALLGSVCARAASGTTTPPPAVSIPPVIGGVYGNDTDQSRIDDRLEERVTAKRQATAGAVSRGLSSQAAGDTVAVELIFSKPVTQSQIDAFTGMGGTITYMYQAISYGWTGRISLDRVSALPGLMGSSLVLVEPTVRVRLYNTDRATLGGRVRPVWRPGFAGSALGFNGDPNTTIGFMDTGVDAEHQDLAGRLVYWQDLNRHGSLTPVDHYGHGTAVSGMALGTGAASGVEAGPFTYTYTDAGYGSAYQTYPIGLANGPVTITTKAWWDGSDGLLLHFYWDQGTSSEGLTIIGDYVSGTTQTVLTNSFAGNNQRNYCAYIQSSGLSYFNGGILVNTVSTYPAVGDGFTRFRGVAPECKYAMVRIPVTVNDEAFENSVPTGLDLLVANRMAKNIKIISLSIGLLSDITYIPVQSTSLRYKIASAANGGIVVVSAAGNEAGASSEVERTMSDPPGAALAITVGASNEKNALTEYSTYGYVSPRAVLSEDYKPDIIAPGGSFYYTCLALPDSGSSDAFGEDKEPNDYITTAGTSFSSPFVAGCAALVIQAMEQKGIPWDYSSSLYPRYVKMVLCATASETDADRESGTYNPSLQRAARGPDGFPAGKDRYEGYGMVNADAAIEAVSLTYSAGAVATETLGSCVADRRVWARTMDLKQGRDVCVTLTNPSTGDFDLYLYSSVPSATGTPVLLASSANPGSGGTERLTYAAAADSQALLVVKRVAGSGTFAVSSVMPGPPTACDIQTRVAVGAAATVTLNAMDDGAPNPPGCLTLTIASLPQHGRLEQADGGAVIAAVPATLSTGVKQVVYRPNAGWVGDDSFTCYGDDGGVAPSGGRSNTATVSVTTTPGTAATYQVAAGANDAHVLRGGGSQKLGDTALSVGLSHAGVRFTGVNIPQGATILQARLRLCSYANGLSAKFTGTILAGAADNAGDFSCQSINATALTTAMQCWALTTSWQSNTWYQTPDIANVIQEVVNRPGWSANNALVLVLQGGAGASNERRFWSYDGDPTRAPQLEIVYIP